MTITHGYCTLEQAKERLDISTADTADDTILEAVVTAVSRQIDAMTGRRFYSTTADEVRYYTAFFDDVIWVDDLTSVSSLETDADGDRTYETSWSATDYDLCPVNAALDGFPYTYIEAAPLGNYSFPTGRKGVKLTARFGYCADEAHPDVVREACLIQTARIWKRKDAPFGVTGSAEMGQLQTITRLDPDVELLLQGVRKLT